MLREEYNDLLHDIYYEESLDSFTQNNLSKLIDQLLVDQQADTADLYQINKLNNNNNNEKNVKRVNSSTSNYFIQSE
jgi:hypothetical protein